jgi:hypothetical protein
MSFDKCALEVWAGLCGATVGGAAVVVAHPIVQQQEGAQPEASLSSKSVYIRGVHQWS